MKSNFLNKVIRVLPVALCLLTATSCKKMLDVEPQDKLNKVQMYRNVYDADAAVWGVYGKFMNLAKQYILLNELRADLLQYTDNADQYLRQISTHTVTPDNPYTSPKPFYDVILDCNDVLKNFDQMLAEKKLKQEEYNQRYSDILAIRTWVYLQLGIHYGSVPYVTDALEQVSDLHDQSKFPKIKFKELLTNLITSMEQAPTLEEYPSTASLRTTVDAFPTIKMFINKKILMGELYLWNDDYKKAAEKYKEIMEYGTNNPSSADLFDIYKIRYADVTKNEDISVGYIRYRETDQYTLVDENTKGWRSMFYLSPNTKPATWEWIWSLPFDKNFAPSNPFIDLFSPVGGSYLVKPSQAAIDNWNSQTQYNNFPFDARGKLTYRTIGGQPVVMKYLYNYIGSGGGLLSTINDKNGKWFLYRAATMHLHYSEAANRDGRHKIAWALVNNGINSTFDDPAIGDKTNLQQTHDVPPYDFMARSGGSPGPTFTDPWYRGNGIRGRGYVRPIPVVVGSDSTIAVEDMTINEGALETAYEGHRWADLLRVAMRRNDPSFLADKIANKLAKDNVGNAEQIRAKLNAKDWYLPFNW